MQTQISLITYFVMQAHIFCDASSKHCHTQSIKSKLSGKNGKAGIKAGPICFEGRSWTESEKKLTVEHHEVMAIIEAFRQYHPLLAIGKSYVYTDIYP